MMDYLAFFVEFEKFENKVLETLYNNVLIYSQGFYYGDCDETKEKFISERIEKVGCWFLYSPDEYLFKDELTELKNDYCSKLRYIIYNHKHFFGNSVNRPLTKDDSINRIKAMI